MTHRAFGSRAKEGLDAVRKEVARIEALLSRFLPDSEITRVNGSAGVKREEISPDTYEALSQAIAFSRSAPGCFDVTVAPLVALWHTAKASLAPPEASTIEQVLPLVNDRDLILDAGQRTAGLRREGQSVDLGGIGKGVAGDRILEVYERFGVSSAYSNLGGNVVTLGCKPNGTPWQIGIQHPRQENKLIGSVSVVSQAVVTSGDYQRYFADRQGKRHHHILDPRTGYPADSGLISVSIVTDKFVAADPLSTIVFVAGMERGLALLKGFPGTEAILVDIELEVCITPGLRNRFQPAEDIKVTILGKV